MKPCCPPGEGCNSPQGNEPCSLERLRRSSDPQASRALRLWERYLAAVTRSPRGYQGRRRASGGKRRRAARRAYSRGRDRALGPWTPWRTAR